MLRTPYKVKLAMRESEYECLVGGLASVVRQLYFIKGTEVFQLTSTLGIRFSDETNLHLAEIVFKADDGERLLSMDEYDRLHARGNLAAILREMPRQYKSEIRQLLRG